MHDYIYWIFSGITFILFYSTTYKGQEIVLIPFITLILVSAYYSPRTTKIRYIIYVLLFAILLRYLIHPEILTDTQKFYREWLFIIGIAIVPVYGSRLALRRAHNYELIHNLFNKNRKTLQRLNLANSKLIKVHNITKNRNKDLERDLEKARDIQQILLPKNLPFLQNAQISTIYEPANLVGGDFYDIKCTQNSDTLMILIADVFGHGVPASLVAAMTKVVMDQIHWHDMAPCEVLHNINRALYQKTAGHLLSIFIIQIDYTTMRLRFANAGHPEPVLFRKFNSTQNCSASGPLIGLLQEPHFEEGSLPFQRGDNLLLFTDGITDVFNSKKISLGEENLLRIASKINKENPQHWVEEIYQAAKIYSSSKYIEDDITLLGVRL